ncbi:MAG: DHA2 family efflux MFS transporter permease subunit, partial [Acidobacteriaceae bacterium]
VLCGLSTSMPVLILFRILQGVGGGGLQPSEQAILADTFAPEQRNMAFSIYGMAVVVAPALGPTLGGWITDNYSWHWIFFINLPIGILSLFLTHRLIHDPPYIKKREAVERRRKDIDYAGISLIVIGVGFLQYALDKGQEAGWLASHAIALALVLGIGGLGLLVWREVTYTNPIINLRLLALRNFGAATLFNFILGMVLNGSTILIPQFLQAELGYTAERAGMALSAGGIALALLMPVAGILAQKFDSRKLIAFGFIVTSLTLFLLTMVYSTIDFNTIMWLRVLQVIGLPFIFIPISTLSYVGVPREENNQVSGISNFSRNIGGAIGVSFLSTFIARHEQINRFDLVAHLNHGSIFFNNYFNGLISRSQGSTKYALAQLEQMVSLQASTLAYVNAFWMMGLVVACLTPLPFLMRKPTPQDLAASEGMH